MRFLQCLIALSALATLFLFSCSEQEPLKIGFMGSMAGRSSELCLSARDGAQLALEAVNMQGGINGRQIELVVFDNRNNSAKAREGVNVLTEAGVAAIIGPSTSQMSKAATPVANSRKTVLISPTSSTVELSGLDDYFFRVYPTSYGNARRLAEHAITASENQRIAILSNLANASFTGPWQTAFTQRIVELGGEIVTTISFNSEDKKTSFLELAQKIIEAEPDGILILTNSIDAGLFSQQVNKLVSGIDLYGSDWTFSGELVQYGGKSVEGFTFTTNLNMDDEAEGFKTFKNNFQARFDKEPNFPSVFAYEATQLLLDALRKDPNPENLQQTLKNIGKVKGLQGDYKIDSFGDVERRTYLNEVRNGKFAKVEGP